MDEYNDYWMGEDFGDVEEIVGQVGPAPAMVHRPMQMQMQPRQQFYRGTPMGPYGGGPGTRLVAIKRQRPRQLPIPLSRLAIAAAATVDVVTTAEEIFRPRRLVIDPTSAGNFRINDFKVGNRSQLISSGVLPGTMFSALAVGVGLRGDTARVGQSLTANITSIAAAPADFVAGILGDSIQ